MLCLNDVVLVDVVLNGVAISGAVELTRHIHHCCDLTFRAFRAQNTNLEHLYIIEVLMHVYATIMFKDSRCSL